MRSGRIAELRKRAPWYKTFLSDKSFDDNAREVEGYNQKALKNAPDDSPVWHHLPRWYGMEETSAGQGAVTELIRDAKGQPGQTLEHYLKIHGLDEAIRGALLRFADWLRSTRVMTKNLLPHNLVIHTESGQPELYLIDGLGSATFLPLENWFEYFNSRYIERRIQRMWARIDWEVSDKSLNWKQAEKASRRR